jgi:hypothetical protein
MEIFHKIHKVVFQEIIQVFRFNNILFWFQSAGLDTNKIFADAVSGTEGVFWGHFNKTSDEAKPQPFRLASGSKAGSYDFAIQQLR